MALMDQVDEFYSAAANDENAPMWKESLNGHPLEPKASSQEMSYANLRGLTSDSDTTLHMCQLCTLEFVPPTSLGNEKDPNTEVRIMCECGEEIALDKREGEEVTSRKLPRHYHLGCLQTWYNTKQVCPNCNRNFAKDELVHVADLDKGVA